MDVEKVCTVHILSKREAWFLFKEKVGTCVDDLKLAEAVVNECGGLPVALVTVGRALKDKTSKYIWDDALRQLRSSNPLGLSNVLKEVYNPLKLSYDFLDNPHAKSIFLLCSMFPEDWNISLEKLILYGWGLRMFGGVGNLGEARNYVYTLTDILKSRSLLLDVEDSNEHVRMHDVIRDTAIFIASKEGRFNLSSGSILDWWREHPHSDCTWISLYPKEGADFLSGLIFQNLHLLVISNLRETQYQIRDQFFEETNGLHVLSMSLFSSLPQTVQLLKHLRTLYLWQCTIDNISVVGELSCLEILYCYRCDFRELPTEIGKLNRLRLLEVFHCWNLKRIATGALSQLVQLEELKIVKCFDKWDIASLRELKSLSSLTCLEIEIQDSALAAEELCL